MLQRAKLLLLFISIVVFGFFLRTYNLNWDQNHHLHPDERFLTMLALELEVPDSFTEYLDPNSSTLNPRNKGYNFFVYGTFPITLNKVVAVIFGNDTYNDFTLQGRLLSAIAETLIIALVFISTRKLSKILLLPSYSAYFAAWFYATLVISIQLSHFFATDTFANLFVFASASLLITSYTKSSESHTSIDKPLGFGSLARSVFAGGWFGLAMASKISALYVLPLLGMVLFLSIFTSSRKLKTSTKQITQLFLSGTVVGGIFLLSSFVSLRLADPTFFASSSFFNPTVNPKLLQNIKELKSWEGGDVWFPPAIQWIPTKPWLFPIKNLSLYGLGLPHVVLMGLGISILVVYSIKRKKHRLLIGIMLLWMMLFFGYQGAQFVKAMRYFLVMLPYISLLSGMGIAALIAKVKTHSQMVASTIKIFVPLSLLVWPAMFMSVYVNTNTRIAASQWIHKHLPSSAVVNESWDDPLPLQIPKTTKSFIGEMMPVFDQESPQKWRTINTMLESADYYFLTSNRAWGSITKVPEKYPETSEFYAKLLNGKLGFVKVAEFTSRPSLKYLGIPFTFSDDYADETFTVYDHPKVIIMAKQEFIPFEPQ